MDHKKILYLRIGISHRRLTAANSHSLGIGLTVVQRGGKNVEMFLVRVRVWPSSRARAGNGALKAANVQHHFVSQPPPPPSQTLTSRGEMVAAEVSPALAPT